MKGSEFQQRNSIRSSQSKNLLHLKEFIRCAAQGSHYELHHRRCELSIGGFMFGKTIQRLRFGFGYNCHSKNGSGTQKYRLYNRNVLANSYKTFYCSCLINGDKKIIPHFQHNDASYLSLKHCVAEYYKIYQKSQLRKSETKKLRIFLAQRKIT